MTVKKFDEFVEQQTSSLKGYINPGDVINWQLIAQTALDAKNVIAAFVEKELQRQDITRTIKFHRTESNNSPIEIVDTLNNVELYGNMSNHNYTLQLCSLRPVRASLYKLARAIKPYHSYVSTANVGVTGTWRQANINSFPNVPFDRPPFREASYWDHWFISLSFWLFSFNSGLYFESAANAGSGKASTFTLDLQAAALMDLDSYPLKFVVSPLLLNNSFIRNTSNGTGWSYPVQNMTLLMTLSQSIDTLLELPELRLGVICANYLKNLGELLTDVIDYNIDCIHKSDESVTYYVLGKIRIIREFTLHELDNLKNLTVGRIPCDNDQNGLRITMPSSNYFVTRTCSTLPNVRSVIERLPLIS